MFNNVTVIRPPELTEDKGITMMLVWPSNSHDIGKKRLLNTEDKLFLHPNLPLDYYKKNEYRLTTPDDIFNRWALVSDPNETNPQNGERQNLYLIPKRCISFNDEVVSLSPHDGDGAQGGGNKNHHRGGRDRGQSLAPQIQSSYRC